MNFSTQVHDFNPGITPYPNGLFWTIPFPADAIEVHLGAGRASMTASNLAISDFFNAPNALFRFQRPVSVPATVSFDVTWTGPVTDRVHFTDSTNGFSAEFFFTKATIAWSAHTSQGFSFVSDTSGTTSVIASLSRLRNGRFFAPG